MSYPRIYRWIGIALLLVLPACAPPGATRHAQKTKAPAVVVISIDGLRPDAIEWADARTLGKLLREGAYSLSARTILPSKTLPSHASMLTGVEPEVHGISWNDDRSSETGVIGVPTVFELAHARGNHTAAFFGKAKFRHLLRPNSLDWATAPRGNEVLLAPRMAEDVESYLRFRRPDLLFVHISDPDINGHMFGWMSGPYRWGVRRADAAVGKILAAVERSYGDDVVVIVTADHGGHGRNHGTDSKEDVTIPWIAWGRGVAPGKLEGQIRTFDTAATTLWLLGVPIPGDWAGKPVTDAFASPTRAQLAP